jgi:hypothetical protein
MQMCLSLGSTLTVILLELLHHDHHLLVQGKE